MTVKYILLAVLCATFVFSCHGGWITWVKLNTSPVCFGAKDNSYGAFTHGKNAFIWAFMLKHHPGNESQSGVKCDNSRGGKSLWGCRANQKEIYTFLTDERNNIIGPRFSEPSEFSKYSVKYELPGYNSDSPFLIFFMGKSAYGLHYLAELRLWYSEDLLDYTEYNNEGTSCADVFGLMYK